MRSRLEGTSGSFTSKALGRSHSGTEQKIKTETEDKFKLYNFLRPTKREAIQLRIEFLQETKKDIQRQIASAERPAQSNLAASQLKYETASKLVEYAEKARAQQGREMPCPSLKDQSWPK